MCEKNNWGQNNCEDGFYADIPGIFDLLDECILDNGGGVDGFKGFNVLNYAIQIPLDQLEAVPGFPTVGVYASVSRQRLTLCRANAEPINAEVPFVSDSIDSLNSQN